MAQIKQDASLPASQHTSRRNRLLPFGIGGTLVLAGVLSIVSPFVGALVAAAPLAYLTVDRVLRPAWRSLKQQAFNAFRLNRFRLPEGHYGNLKVSDGSKTGNSIVDALVDKLRSNGLQVSTDWDAAKDILKQLPDKYETLKREDAKVYGFVYQGTIFLNPKDTGADVPIHEYTHVWAEALRQNNPDEWNRIKEMMKRETTIWNEVVATYPHLETDDQIADEVLATYSGRHGALRLQEHCDNGQRPDQVFKSLLTALERFWKNVSLFFRKDVHYDNPSDVADRILSDFLTGVNPNRHIDENNITLSDEVPLASQELHNKNTDTAMNEHLVQLLSAALPEKGRIELPRVFGLDQPIAVGTYDMDAKYITRDQDGSCRFSDGEYSLPLSRLMDHQVDSLCQLLEEYQKNEQLQSADREHNKVSELIRNIRDLVGSHAGTNDVDVFLQKPVSIGHGVQVMGVNVAMSNTHDDRLILRNVDNSDLYYSNYRYYDGDLHDGVKTHDTLNSKQLSAVCKELQGMEQRHTLFPVQRTYTYSYAAIIPGVVADKQTLLKTKRNPSMDSISVYSGELTLVRKEGTGLSNIDNRLDKMFDRAVLRAVESLMSRNGVVREVNPLTLKYNYAVILDTYSKSNLDAGEEPLKKTGGDDLKSLEIIAKAYDGDAVVYREDDKIAKVTFSDLQAANQFASSYFRREQEAVSAVKNAVKQGYWSELGKAYVNAFIVEHGGVDKPTREVAANSLLKASDILNISSLHKDSIKNDLMTLAHTIPVVTYYSSEAKEKFNEIMAGQQSTEVADYFPLHIGASGIFEETTADGHHAFVAFDNSSGDNWTEDFKTMKGAELYVGGTLSAEDIRQLERQQFRNFSKPLLIDTIILNKEDVSSSLAKILPFDDQGELEVKMSFFDGYAEELRQRDGITLADSDRLKLTYPTISAVASSQKMQNAIEEFTDRQWRGSSLGEKVYDIALKYGNVSKLYERANEVPKEIGDVEIIAQDALYDRIDDYNIHAFTGKQKQALSAYQQSFGTVAGDVHSLSDRLMKGIQDRLASAGVPELRINDVRLELNEFFRGIERDKPQTTEADFVKLVLPYLNDKFESVLVPVSVPVHENPSGQYAHQVNKTQDYIPQSLGVLFNVEHQTMQVLYDHHHMMENGHEYHTVLGLPFDQLTPKEVNSLYESLQGDLEENGKLFAAGITESEDENEEVLFDVAFDVSSDDEQQALADKHNVESVDEENNISSFNDFDDAVYFAAENLAALQQRPDLVQDLRDKDSVVDIIIARMKDPAARAFTPEQAQTVRDYIIQSDDVKIRLADANDLYYSAASSEDVKSISSSWKEDVKNELSDLAKGIFRDESRGLHR